MYIRAYHIIETMRGEIIKSLKSLQLYACRLEVYDEKFGLQIKVFFSCNVNVEPFMEITIIAKYLF